MSNGYFHTFDRDLGLRILMQDPCYCKIRPEDIQSVLDEALDFGASVGREFCQQQGARPLSMTDMFRRAGIQIHTLDQDYVVGNTRYCCEYLSRKNIIRIYQRAVMLWAKNAGLSYTQSINFILSHEYFHYLETNVVGLASKHYTVPMLRLGTIRLGKTGICAISEIAANAFAAEVWRMCVAQDSLQPQHPKLSEKSPGENRQGESLTENQGGFWQLLLRILSI